MARKTAEEFAEALNNLASDLFGEDDSDSRDKWFNDHMKAAGYKPTLSWGDSDDENGGDETPNYFGKSREKRAVRRSSDKPKRDWLYG